MAATKLCAIAGCGKRPFTAGWCAGHYHRWRKHGSPLGGRWPVSGCSVDGCAARHKAKGFCSDHYSAFRRHGNPLGGCIRTEPGALLEWLHANVGRNDEACLLWPFGRYANQYGHVTFGSQDTTAHRVMCVLAHGEPASPELDAAHSCNNPPCCNPTHLRWATKCENAADKIAAGTHSTGEKNGAAKLTLEDVGEIRRLRGRVDQVTLGRRFGITKSNVSAIQLRKSWAHIE